MPGLAEIVRLRDARTAGQAAARLPAVAAGEAGVDERVAPARGRVPALPGRGGRLPAHPAPAPGPAPRRGAVAARARWPPCWPPWPRAGSGEPLGGSNRVLRAGLRGRDHRRHRRGRRGRGPGLDEPAPAGSGRYRASRAEVPHATGSSRRCRARRPGEGAPQSASRSSSASSTRRSVPSLVSGHRRATATQACWLTALPSSVSASRRTRRSPGSGRRSTRPRSPADRPIR